MAHLLLKERKKKMWYKVGNVKEHKLNLSGFMKLTVDSIGELTPRELTVTMLSMAKIARNVIDETHKLNFNQRAFGNVFLLEGDADIDVELFRPFLEMANSTLQTFGARCLSNLVYSLALLGCNPTVDGVTMLDTIAARAVHLLNMQDSLGPPSKFDIGAYAPQVKTPDQIDQLPFDSEGISNTLYSFASLNVSHSQLFQAMGDAVVAFPNLETFTHHQLSVLVWSFAKVNESHADLYDKVANAVMLEDNMGEFMDSALSNIVWSFATQQISNPELFQKVANHFESRDDFKYFSPQSLANIVWAYASSGVREHSVFNMIGNEVVKRPHLRKFMPCELVDLVWAVATINGSHPKMFEKIGDCIAEKEDLQCFEPRHLVTLVWAFASTNAQHSGLFNKVGDTLCAMDDLTCFERTEIANILWAYASAGQANSELFKKIADWMIDGDDLSAFLPRSLAEIAWAFATANYISTELFAKIGDVLSRPDQWKAFHQQDYPNLAWAFAVADIDAPSLFNRDFAQALVEEENNQPFSLEALSQLYQWHLWLTREKMNDPNFGLSQELLDRASASLAEVKSTSSGLRNTVLDALVSIGLDPEKGYVTKSGYSLDALIEVDGRRIGVEVVGPLQYNGKNPTGMTVLKHRQIDIVDKIPVVSVPYSEWREVCKNRRMKKRYLRNLLSMEQSD